nr:Gfo/Idh/MocA family oxidoreductase [Cellvibrionaceae bacterium]
MVKKKRIVIVGAKFGELYLNNFIEAQPELALVGLVAKGSARAVNLADAFGVTLYRSVDDLPNNIDIASFLPAGYQLRPNKIYKFKLAVGSPWHSIHKFFKISVYSSQRFNCRKSENSIQRSQHFLVFFQ